VSQGRRAGSQDGSFGDFNLSELIARSRPSFSLGPSGGTEPSGNSLVVTSTNRGSTQGSMRNSNDSQDSPVPGGVIVGAPVEIHKKSITHLQKLFDSIKDKNQVTADGQVNKMKEGQNGTSVIQSLGDQQWLAASQQAENKLDEVHI
jgi:hypothetical protein